MGILKKIIILFVIVFAVLVAYLGTLRYVEYATFKPLITFVDSILEHPEKVNTLFVEGDKISTAYFMQNEMGENTPKKYFNGALDKFKPRRGITYFKFIEKNVELYSVQAINRDTGNQIKLIFSYSDNHDFVLQSIAFDFY